MAKKETLKISLHATNESVLLYTLVTAESDLKIVSILNLIFGIRLTLSDDLILNVKGSELHFKKYLFETEERDEKFVFLDNRSNGNYLLQEYKKIDYVFIIFTEELTPDFQQKINQLKSNSCISAVFNLQPHKVKSFSQFRF